MKPRTKTRASSRAHTPCPHCGKKLHGKKGMLQHLHQQHADAPLGARP